MIGLEASQAEGIDWGFNWSCAILVAIGGANIYSEIEYYLSLSILYFKSYCHLYFISASGVLTAGLVQERVMKSVPFLEIAIWWGQDGTPLTSWPFHATELTFRWMMLEGKEFPSLFLAMTKNWWSWFVSSSVIVAIGDVTVIFWKYSYGQIWSNEKVIFDFTWFPENKLAAVSELL